MAKLNYSFFSGPDDDKTSEAPLVAKMDKSNGVQIVKNGTSAKHNNNLDKKQSTQEPYETKDLGTKKVKACMLKTFNRMKKRIGFLIYQFVLPALQVILIFKSILEYCFLNVNNPSISGISVLLSYRSRPQRITSGHSQLRKSGFSMSVQRNLQHSVSHILRFLRHA